MGDCLAETKINDSVAADMKPSPCQLPSPRRATAIERAEKNISPLPGALTCDTHVDRGLSARIAPGEP